MKLAFAADLHIRPKDLDVTLRQLETCFQVAARNSVRHFFFAGDIFDKPDIVASNHSATVGDIVGPLKDLLTRYTPSMRFYFISGQHDQASASTGTAISVLDGMENVVIAKEPTWATGVSARIAFLPWGFKPSSYDDIEKLLDTIPDSSGEPLILVAHLQVNGAKVNGGRICESGSYSVSKSQLEATPFNHFAFGDFHARQEAVTGRGGYVGALRQVSFGHCGEPQGFEIYDTDTLTAQFIEINEAPRHEILNWNEGEEQPTRSDGFHTRIRTEGWTPQVGVFDTGSGAALDVRAEKTEARIQHTDDIDISDRHALLDLWLSATGNDAAAERLHALLDESIL